MLESLKRKQPREIIELVSSGQQVTIIVTLEGIEIKTLIDLEANINAIDKTLVQI